MRVVADRLADWAASEADADNADLFGRSAFNRYYYAAYLITREMLRKLDPKWAASGHRQIPDLLQKTVTKKARQSIKNAEKNRLIDPGMASWLRQSLNLAVSELSNLLATAYNVRVVADYSPETHMERSHGTFVLESQSLSTARNWPARASAYSKAILRVWKETGLD